MLAKVRHTKTLKIEGTIDTVLNRSHDIELECLYYTSLSYLCTDAVFDASFHILLVFAIVQGESYILGQIFASTTTTSIDIEKILHIFWIVHNVSFLEMSMNHL